MTAARRDELAAALQLLRDRVDRACGAADRDPAQVTVIAVTKTRPATDVRCLAELGVLDVGENRDQEAAPKAGECADLPLRWHFVGGLQTNKCRSVVRYASAVHSLDRARLVGALDRAAAAAGRTLDAFVQVSLDDVGDPGRSGIDPDHALELAGHVAQASALRLAGVMAVAPRGADPVPAFARLAAVAAAVRERWPEADAVSAGMSGDLEAAVAAGATHLRIGTALLGGRAPVVR